MNVRAIALIILGIASLATVVNVASIPSDAWNILSGWETANIVLSVLVTFATFLLAYWIHSDYEENQSDIANLTYRINCLETDLREKASAEKLTKTKDEKKETVQNKPDNATYTSIVGQYLQNKAEKQSQN